VTMTPEQRSLVKETYPDIKQIAIPVSLLFYGRLFDLDPSLRALFHIDMTEQSRKLMEMLDAIVGSLDSFEDVRPVLRELGQRHVGYGVKESHYATLGSDMVWGFAHAVVPKFNDSVREAWGAVLGEVSREMLLGAAEGPPPA
jgi:hemoglobin-like flavoprotein